MNVSRIVMMSIMSVMTPTIAVLMKDFSNVFADPILFVCMFTLMFLGIAIQNRFIDSTCNKEFNAKAASMNAGMYVIVASFGYILYNTIFPESTGVLMSILKSFFVLVPANLWYYFQDKVYIYKCE